LATKFGVTKDAETGAPTVRSDAEYVKQACEKSLKRLGVDKIDLFYCHRVDMKTPIEETVAAMAELKKAGKIGAIGLSEISAATLRRAQKIAPIAALQIEYSPFALDIENPEIDVLNTCRELGISVIAYSPLGRGFLTGQIKSPDDFEDGDFRKHAPRYSKENFPKNLKLVHALETIAKKKGCTPGQLALAWLLEQGDDIIPIP
jgi:aryl-alcohol dehydrogenase-like predicted oxidoreductase